MEQPEQEFSAETRMSHKRHVKRAVEMFNVTITETVVGS